LYALARRKVTGIVADVRRGVREPMLVVEASGLSFHFISGCGPLKRIP
jgi:hypothetical protein